MILHICSRDDWRAAQGAGAIEPGPAGFVHLSSAAQVHVPATLFYAGRPDLLLLHVDEERLPVPVTWEQGDPPDPGGMLFPHLYAALPVAAVTAVTPYRPESDGSFRPPEV